MTLEASSITALAKVSQPAVCAAPLSLAGQPPRFALPSPPWLAAHVAAWHLAAAAMQRNDAAVASAYSAVELLRVAAVE